MYQIPHEPIPPRRGCFWGTPVYAFVGWLMYGYGLMVLLKQCHGLNAERCQNTTIGFILIPGLLLSFMSWLVTWFARKEMLPWMRFVGFWSPVVMGCLLLIAIMI